MNGDVVWIGGAGTGDGILSFALPNVALTKTDQAIAWLRERKRYCLDQKQPRIVPVVKPTLLDQWLATRKI